MFLHEHFVKNNQLRRINFFIDTGGQSLNDIKKTQIFEKWYSKNQNLNNRVIEGKNRVKRSW